MAVPILDKMKNQVRNLQTLSDELQVQMALGKAEAKEAIEKEKKTLSEYINKQKQEIKKAQSLTDERRKNFLTCVEDLETMLFSEIPSSSLEYDKYKNSLLRQVYKLEEEVKENYPTVNTDMQETLDLFKAKMDAFRVNLALHDKDDPEKVERIRNEFTAKLTDVRTLLEAKKTAQTKVDSFVDDISESFSYLKRAISELSN